MVSTTEEVLARAHGSDAHVSALCRSQLHRVLDHVRRLAASETGEEVRCEAETPLEVEVLQLRRELAEAKVQLAELTAQSFADKKELASLRATSKSGRFW